MTSAATPCSLIGPDGVPAPGASAFFSSTPTLPASFGPTTSFSESASVQVFAEPGGSELESFSSEASASVDSEITAISSGPPREGVIELSTSGTGDTIAGGAAATGQVGPYGDVFPAPPLIDALQPFELGVPFQIDLSAEAGADGVYPLGLGDAGASVTLSFSLFESDGVTPVTFASVPEPGTIVLCMLGLVASILASLLKPVMTDRRPRQIASCGRGSESARSYARSK
jgi:hypothetical protein